MAGPLDLTGQNIEDTYQRILQTDGNSIYDGTGSLFTVTAVAAPAGPNQSIQFNDAGATSGSANFTFDKTTNNVILTGSIIFPPDAYSVYFSGSSNVGQLVWNDNEGTLDLGLKGGSVTLQIGQKQVARVVNKTGADLLKAAYKVARIRRSDEGGTQGQRLAIVLAQGNNDANSVDTLGIVTENIAVNQEGFIVTSGLVTTINTTGTLQGETWSDGDVIYLSPFIAGQLTNIKPLAPNHTVIIGYVVYAHQNNGKIFVKVDNGYEIDELHNVRITTGSLGAGQLLVRSGSNNGGVWINSNQLTGSYGLTGSLSVTQGTLFATSSWATHAVTASYISPTFISASAAASGFGSGVASATNTGSLLTTASVSLNVITFTKGDNSQFNITVDTGSGTTDTSNFVTKATFNSFTSSYTTGSFTGSFTGYLYGTSSWAIEAVTASFAPAYVLNSVTASMLSLYVLNSATSSFILSSQTASFIVSSQTASFVTNSQTSSFVLNSQTSSFVTNSQTSSFVVNSQTGSFVINSQTASFITNSQTSSMTVLSSSYSITASYIDPLFISASAAQYGFSELTNITALNEFSASILAFTSSIQGTVDGLVGQVESLSTNLDKTIVTASVSLNTITFTKTDSSQFSIAIETGSFVLNAQTASMLSPYVLNSSTSSFIVTSQTASFITTASVSLNTITFTKGDSSQFSIVVNTGSATGGSGITELTGDVTAGPGSGAQAATLKGTYKSGSFGITVDGQGGVITTGDEGYVVMPYSGVITSWVLLADRSGSIGIDIRKSTFESFPPTAANTICGAANYPSITTNSKNRDTTLTGWTTSFSQGDVMNFNVTSSVSITRANLIVNVLKT